MNELRQGVSPTEHAVLDCFEENAVLWDGMHDIEDQLHRAKRRARAAVYAPTLAEQHRFAIEAAARLIDVADRIGRLMS